MIIEYDSALYEAEENNRDTSKGKLLSETNPALGFVKMFRARDAKSDEFNTNDYVTLSPKFAVEHAENNHIYNDEPQIVIRKLVSTNLLREASNPGEYFYIGPFIKGELVYRTLGEDFDSENIPDLRYSKKVK